MGDVITIGLLHPGEMGAAVGECLVGAGHRVLWVPEGRSAATAARARTAGLTAADGGLAGVVRRSGVVMSVCPPHAALGIAREVAGFGFGEVYVDANAISPTTAHEVAAIVEGGGASYVDGGIIGTPPAAPGFVRLYLSGARAGEVARLFAGSDVDARVVGDGSGVDGSGAAGSGAAGSGAAGSGAGSGAWSGADGSGAGSGGWSGADGSGAGSGGWSGADGSGAGSGGWSGAAGSPFAASAVKMAYASWTKGSAALLLAARAMARAEGVEEALLGEWAISQPELADRSARAAGSAAAKGWRWVAEMEEIATAMAAAGLPDGFHLAAADIYRRSRHAPGPALEEVLAALRRHPG
jgi:hypothetical protein